MQHVASQAQDGEIRRRCPRYRLGVRLDVQHAEREPTEPPGQTPASDDRYDAPLVEANASTVEQDGCVVRAPPSCRRAAEGKTCPDSPERTPAFPERTGYTG